MHRKCNGDKPLDGHKHDGVDPEVEWHEASDDVATTSGRCPVDWVQSLYNEHCYEAAHEDVTYK